MPVNAPNDNLDVLAPSFNLKNIDDEMVSLDNKKGLIKNGCLCEYILISLANKIGMLQI